MIQLRRHMSFGLVHSVVRERMVNGVRMYCVIGTRTGRNFGCYMTKAEADARLRMIERFD